MATNVFDQFDAPSAKVETEDQGPPLGPNGEPLNLPLNSGAANIYSNNAPEIKNIFDQFDSPAQTDKQVLAQPTPTPEQTGKVINLPAIPSKEQQPHTDQRPEIPEISAAKPMGYREQLGRFMSPLLGPTEAQRFEEAVPVDPNLSEQEKLTLKTGR